MTLTPDKVAWLVNLAVIFLCARQAADATLRVAVVRLAPTPAIVPASGGAEVPSKPIIEARLRPTDPVLDPFNGKPFRPPPPPATPPPCVGPDCPPADGSIPVADEVEAPIPPWESIHCGAADDPNDGDPCEPLDKGTLLATLAAAEPLYALARIQDGDGKSTGTYGLMDDEAAKAHFDTTAERRFPDPAKRAAARERIVGNNKFGDHTLIRVCRRKVYLQDKAGKRFCLAMDKDRQKKGKPGEGGSPEPSFGGGSASIDGGDEGVRQIGENQFETTREYIDRQLENMADLQTQVRVTLNFVNGQPNGFRLFSIKPGSVFDKLGLKNGDILTRINGADINSMEAALGMYQKLKGSDRVQADVLRRGAPVSMELNVR